MSLYKKKVLSHIYLQKYHGNSGKLSVNYWEDRWIIGNLPAKIPEVIPYKLLQKMFKKIEILLLTLLAISMTEGYNVIVSGEISKSK